MAENNIDKALAYLGTSISTLIDASKAPFDTTNLHTLLAKRSLTGDHINGGMIVNFASKGIKDEATSQQLVVNDTGIVTNTVTARTIKVDVLEVGELKTATPLVSDTSPKPLAFTAEGTGLYGKGVLWTGLGPAKQLIFAGKPDKFFSTEHFELAKEKEFRIDNNPVLTSTELGVTVTKSNIRELGRLKGLIVDGSVSIDQYIFYNSTYSRLGLGTEEPNAGLSVCEDSIEVVLGTREQSKGMVGTYASTPFEIVTDDTARISISATGNILLGNRTQAPIEVTVHGKLGIGVKSIDTRADLHVGGAIKFNDHIHQYAEAAPESGTYTKGDIVWNTNPRLGSSIGWVCIQPGTPGAWLPFGEIKNNV
jgi:hypothetical protein